MRKHSLPLNTQHTKAKSQGTWRLDTIRLKFKYMSLGTTLQGRQWRVYLCLHLKLWLSETGRRFLRETRAMKPWGFIKKRICDVYMYTSIWCVEGWIWELRCSGRYQVTGKEDGKCSKQNSRMRNHPFQGCESSLQREDLPPFPAGRDSTAGFHCTV